ncbi:hypothetical protein NKH36_33695 [Mesorhizobium sp. M1312]|uniref:hypothetical protein n=1 Tax=Mesorhizobium sp. M1312 TaxID=2957080 RepID=UPI0033358C13
MVAAYLLAGLAGLLRASLTACFPSFGRTVGANQLAKDGGSISQNPPYLIRRQLLETSRGFQKINDKIIGMRGHVRHFENPNVDGRLDALT